MTSPSVAENRNASVDLTKLSINTVSLKTLQIAGVCGVASVKATILKRIYEEVWGTILLKEIKESILELSNYPEIVTRVSSSHLNLSDAAKHSAMLEVIQDEDGDTLIRTCIAHHQDWCVDVLYTKASSGIFNNYMLRILFYSNHAKDYTQSLHFKGRQTYPHFVELMDAVIDCSDGAFLLSRDPRLLLHLYTIRYTDFTSLQKDLSNILLHPSVMNSVSSNINEETNMLPGLGIALFLAGDLKNAKHFLAVYDQRENTTLYPFLMQALIHCDLKKAVIYYDNTITAWRKKTKKRSSLPNTPYTILFLFVKALVEPQQAEVCHRQAIELENYFEHNLWFAHFVRGLKDTFPKHFIARIDNRTQWPGFFTCHIWFWFYRNDDKESVLPDFIRSHSEYLLNGSGKLLGLHLADLYPAEFGSKTIKPFEALFKERTPFNKCYVEQQDWEKVLSSLSLLAPEQSAQEPEDNTPQSRIVWNILPPFDVYEPEDIALQPIEQKQTKSTAWTKGRAISLKRIKGVNVPNMLPQDKEMGRFISESPNRGYWKRNKEYELNIDKALPALIGHPHVTYDSGDTFIELHKATPELTLYKSKTGYNLSFNIPTGEGKTQLIETGKNRFGVIEITPKLQTISKAFNNGDTEIPLSAEKELYTVLNGVAGSITIHSDSGSSIGDQQIEATRIEPQERLICRFTQQDAGWSIDVVVRPFGDSGTSYPPGEGPETVFTTIDQKPHVTTRILENEQLTYTNLLNSSPATNHALIGNEGMVESLEECLTVLKELFPLQEIVTLEWPDKKPVNISHVADFSNLKIKAKKQKEWFTLEGELKVDSTTVYAMTELLDKLEKSATKGFIKLDGDNYLAITDELNLHLRALNDLGTAKEDLLRINGLLLPQVEELLEESGNATRNAAWKKQVQKIDSLSEFTPELPSTFQAELREYQLEGFNWLSTLHEWGVGACLADDMGLGKTIQALALLVSVAHKGPSLILAPVSVCFNWEQECRRFAPTLNPILLNEGHRESIISEAQPYDLIICTYGLLHNEIKHLKTIEWNTVVFDEAQALKNSSTKRSKAAKQIPAAHKVITTGTPIENHLGELWNLFDLINPGLLGSQEQFTNRFGLPIMVEQSHQKRESLKRIVSPFILRRLKSTVLTELPAKTEITLSVTLSKDEQALYEAVRQKAEALTDDLMGSTGGSPKGKGQKHLEILKEIMRLRQACCNPKLIDPSSTITSSKLTLFADIVTELIENNHKTLVFSQFTSHLALIKEYLDRQNIAYQYLDGSTPQSKRKKAVEAFQRGEGDLFLISLKAGGSGLNLTAADYVIHMDPWWNPAVEDQASDRAHRIGQKRPVTIYRMVAKGTIEEKILELHKEKKDLADSLLEGTAKAGKMSADQLLGLLRDEGID